MLLLEFLLFGLLLESLGLLFAEMLSELVLNHLVVRLVVDLNLSLDHFLGLCFSLFSLAYFFFVVLLVGFVRMLEFFDEVLRTTHFFDSFKFFDFGYVIVKQLIDPVDDLRIARFGQRKCEWVLVVEVVLASDDL